LASPRSKRWDRYRGVLTLESEENKGTVVTVTLPLMTKQTPREPL